MTRLPASEEAFNSGKEELCPFLDEVFSGSSYSSFAGTLVVCAIFRVILKHVHRCKPTDHAQDIMDGPFWKRHRDLDNQLSSVFMFLPSRFRIPRALRDPAAIHMNLNLHAAVIILHHAALEKAELHNLGENVIQTSLCRLRASTEEIVNIVKMTSHSTNIFVSPCQPMLPLSISPGVLYHRTLTCAPCPEKPIVCIVVLLLNNSIRLHCQEKSSDWPHATRQVKPRNHYPGHGGRWSESRNYLRLPSASLFGH
jgi:hypothetical protein